VKGERDHYSYSVYADGATARNFDERRFGGPIGDLVASTQARVLTNMMGRIQDRDILDVGTGTGRAALLFARGGARVTAVDASEAMLTIARQRATAQLCRTANRLVIVDYPSAVSVALFEAMARRAAHGLGARTEPYRVFTQATIASAFDRCGFRVRSVHRQFVLPIAFHKAVGSRRLTIRSEQFLDRLGLLKVFGSPVTLVAERCASS
jgi:SAM-dependent methyltransferase